MSFNVRKLTAEEVAQFDKNHAAAITAIRKLVNLYKQTEARVPGLPYAVMHVSQVLIDNEKDGETLARLLTGAVSQLARLHHQLEQLADSLATAAANVPDNPAAPAEVLHSCAADLRKLVDDHG